MCKTNSLRPGVPPAGAGGADDFASRLDMLRSMPQRLAAIAAAVPRELWRTPPAAGGFSLVEHACHLRDIETEAYRARLERMLAETVPFLPDLDGARLARERDYGSQDLSAAADAFARVRAAVVRRLAALSPSERARGGTLEGVGAITVDGLVGAMLEHDGGHLAELAALRDELARGGR